MTDDIDSLLVEVRAGTEGFTRDIEQMRSSLDTNLIDRFSRAGSVLERGLLGAIRRGSLGFDDLKRAGLSAMDAIAAQSVRSLFASAGGGQAGLGTLLGGVTSALLGLPGRATGGNVAPGRGYVVGERGPEVFVPTSAGRVEPSSAPAREVRVAINVAAPRGASVPRSLERSSRQVASTIRRALAQG
ncbi:tail tape measure protein [Novosphingobium sp. PC22D]|uniref:tail tape measure protein n=1 Tax=Novosphingobium sp. PC22D TaxID=1962403 RepID=UPI000BF13F34|nr:tail tape measure protein [Novosphingobium sp. PC22D]PEQ14125.1 tail tape measure protein [Novosphingobium sp. PC22D]